MYIITEHHDAVHIIATFLHGHPVIQSLQDNDPPEDCTDGAYQLGQLADSLGFNGRTPSLREELAAISAACQRFTAAGQYGHAYDQNPEFLLAHRGVLKDSLDAILTGTATPTK